jgi:hypothetical protein
MHLPPGNCAQIGASYGRFGKPRSDRPMGKGLLGKALFRTGFYSRQAWRLGRELLVLRLAGQGLVGFGVIDDFAEQLLT